MTVEVSLYQDLSFSDFAAGSLKVKSMFFVLARSFRVGR